MRPPGTSLQAHRQRDDFPRQSRDDLTLRVSHLKSPATYFEPRGSSGHVVGTSRHYGDLLWPIIAQHEGMVIEIGGDVLMAAFFDPHAGVQSARDCHATHLAGPH